MPRQKPAPVLPGLRLLEALEEHHMSQAELCARIGRSRKLINEIIKGKASIAYDTAIQLELALAIPAAEWNQLEVDFRDHQERRKHEAALAAELDWLDEVPLPAMIEAKWVEEKPTKLEQAQDMLRWFGVATPAQWRRIYAKPRGLRCSPPSFDNDPGALAAWLRAGEKMAFGMETAPYDRKKFMAALKKIRGLTRKAPDVWQDRMIQLSMKAGVAVPFARELPGVRVAGASRWLSPKKAMIQLSLLHRTDADMWFSFFHEAGHILLHGRKLLFVEGVFDGKPSREDVFEEVEADHFAANFLIPGRDLEELREVCRKGDLRTSDVRGFAKRQGVTPGIVATRLQHLGWIGPEEFDGLKNQMEWAPPGTHANY